jgi:cytidylate kinase
MWVAPVFGLKIANGIIASVMDEDQTQTEVALTNRRVVAIDGGTATGKGRLVDELSRLLRSKGVPAIHLSTGSVYRGVTYAALQQARTRLTGKRGASETDIVRQMVAAVKKMPASQLAALAQKHQIELHGGLTWIDGGPADIDTQLKSPGVGLAIPYVAGFSEVREFVNRVTRRQINEFDGFVLLDGRDTTHVVVPDAPLKLMLQSRCAIWFTV